MTDAGVASTALTPEHLHDDEHTRIPSTKISAVVSDVDGTLVTDEKVLTEQAWWAVPNCRQAESYLALSAPGRHAACSLLGPLQITTPLIGFSSGVLTGTDLAIISEHPLSPDVARRAVELLTAHSAQVRGWFTVVQQVDPRMYSGVIKSP
jgi:hydroxymethylpyrimidine pyrophosphatase-like HAD family hydrolase